MRTKEIASIQRCRLLTDAAKLVLAAAVMCLTACSDAATRGAKEIEAGAGNLGAADGARTEVSYSPSGCSGSYTLRIEKGSAESLGNNNFRISDGSGPLSVRCGGSSEGWGTTYHLRFVDVPARLEVEKQRGEAVVIELQRVAGRPTVAGLR